jgi:hypothetical protein
MSIVFGEDGIVKATIPRELYLQIAGLQAAYGLDWYDAAKLAAERIDANNAAFRKSVETEVLRHRRSNLMTEVNKARKTIEDQGYERGKRDYEITYPCSRCGGPLTVSPNGDSHKDIIEYMKKAGWAHKTCLGK